MVLNERSGDNKVIRFPPEEAGYECQSVNQTVRRISLKSHKYQNHDGVSGITHHVICKI